MIRKTVAAVAAAIISISSLGGGMFPLPATTVEAPIA